MGRDVDGRSKGGFDAEGTEAEEKRVHVAGVREGDGAGDSVVVESETEKLRGDRVGLYLVQGRQGNRSRLWSILHFCLEKKIEQLKCDP